MEGQKLKLHFHTIIWILSESGKEVLGEILNHLETKLLSCTVLCCPELCAYFRLWVHEPHGAGNAVREVPVQWGSSKQVILVTAAPRGTALPWAPSVSLLSVSLQLQLGIFSALVGTSSSLHLPFLCAMKSLLSYSCQLPLLGNREKPHHGFWIP